MGSASGDCFFCGNWVYINYSSDQDSGNGVELGDKFVCNDCRKKITFEKGPEIVKYKFDGEKWSDREVVK